MTRYLLRPKVYSRFKTMGYNLVCKICLAPILPGDEVESKTGGEGPKFYHADCYDSYHLDVNGEELRNGLGRVIEPEE